MTTETRPSSRFAGTEPPAASEILLTEVSSHGWQVTDTRSPEHDPSRLMAFIERRDERFEVLQLGAGFEWHELAEAVAFAAAVAPGLARRRFDDTAGDPR